MDRATLIALVEVAIQMRKDPPVPRDYITEAIERIDQGVEEVTRYPLGAPTVKGVYDIAMRLYKEATGVSHGK